MAGLDDLLKKGEDQKDETKRFPCYGLAVGAMPFTLDFIKADGEEDFIEYSYITGGHFNPNFTEFRIRAVDRDYIIKGRNLKPLKEFVRRHRVSYMNELKNDTVEDKDVWVSEIVWIERP